MLCYESFTLGPLDTNTYLLWDAESTAAIIVDPADDGEFLSSVILEKQLSLQAIWLTHAHIDHVLGLLELKLNFGVPVYLHPADDFLLKQAHQSAKHWFKKTIPPLPPADVELEAGSTVHLGSTQFMCLHVPGHTPGSIAFYCEADGTLLGGDVLFAHGVGRTDFSYASILDLRSSLSTLAQLPNNITLMPGHGESLNLGEALKNNGILG
jgi:glyoxylase-like metal-dependent hydrolase (beta-lactamase superfamily II)